MATHQNPKQSHKKNINNLSGDNYLATLGVNVDHVANIRQARCAIEPDPVTAAEICELAGAHGITVHLRSDRRHIQERDLKLLRQVVKTTLNLEMASTEEMLAIALEVKPDQVTLVPEQPGEVTTEGGLDILSHEGPITQAVERLKGAGIAVSLFIDPDISQVEASARTGAGWIEIHTGIYAAARGEENVNRELEKVNAALKRGRELGLRVNAGHDLNYRNTTPIAALPGIEELNIGHSIVARAVFTGLDQAVREMARIIHDAYRR
jgi:pyridoxine 5-phosphate synthase